MSDVEIEDYNESGFWTKCKNYASSIGQEGLEKALYLYFALDHKDCGAKEKATIYGALAYLVSPIDIIPDLTPFLGYSDDIAIIGAAIYSLTNIIDDEVKEKSKNKVKEWFE